MSNQKHRRQEPKNIFSKSHEKNEFTAFLEILLTDMHVERKKHSQQAIHSLRALYK